MRVTADAARVLNHTADAAWLDKEYSAYTADIRASVDRSITLEKTSPKYLPAMPTNPEGAYSQTFLAISPTQIYSPTDPLVTGLLTRMESEKSQGLPTNVAWAGYAGVWPGEAMNMAETYLLTGDMPEAWGNANVVNLLRDMLVQERLPAPGQPGNPALHLFAGLPASWIVPGQDFSITNAPTTLGTTVSVKLHPTSATSMQITIDPGSRPTDLVLHIPVAANQTIQAIRIDGKAATPSAILTLPAASKPTTIDVEIK